MTSQFKAIIPRSKFLLRDKLYFAFTREPCIEIYPKHYFCQRIDLQEIKKESSCEIQLLELKNTSTCERINVRISDSKIKQLGNSNQWIGLFPTQEVIKFICQQQEEIQNLEEGTYLLEIPDRCQVITRQGRITSGKTKSKDQNQLLLFPKLNVNPEENQSKINVSVQLEEIELDDLQKIKARIIENQPDINFRKIYHIPSVWTIIIYGLLIIVIIYTLYKQFKLRCPNRGNPDKQETMDQPNVRLPR